MNDVAVRPTGFGLINREDLAKNLTNASMSIPAVGGDKAFLKMDKNNGDWLFGQEETVVEPDSLWAINPMSIKHGWVAWDTNGGGAPVQEVMVSFNRPLPAVESLPPLGMGTPDKKSGRAEQLVYQRQNSIDLVCISGEDEGTQVEYKQSSTGAMKMFASITNALLDQLAKDPDKIVPVGSLTFDKYKHKQYGWIHNPIFKIVEWRTVDDTSPADEPADEPAQDEAPPARTRTRAAAAPDPKQEADEVAREYEQATAASGAGNDATAPRRRQRR